MKVGRPRKPKTENGQVHAYTTLTKAELAAIDEMARENRRSRAQTIAIIIGEALRVKANVEP